MLYAFKPMANPLFDSLIAAQKDPTEGKALGLSLGIVTSTEDALSLGRIKVTTGDKGGLSETNLLWNTAIAPGVTVPLPRIGDTIVMGFLDANPHTPVYLGTLHNLANPPVPGYTIVLPDSAVFSVIVGSTIFKVDATGVTINGKDVAVVGSKDTRNDFIIEANQ